VTADGSSLTAEAVSDATGRVVDGVALRKPRDWGARFMARRAARAGGGAQ